MTSTNDESWVLASIALVREGDKLQQYSTKQLRNILLHLKTKGIENCLQKCKNYQPSGVLNASEKKKANDLFLQKLSDLCKGKEKSEQINLMRWAFLNINNIANMKDKELAKLLLSTEGVNLIVTESILQKFPDRIPSRGKPRDYYNQKRRFNQYSRGRN
ncbi:MAG: hypothetical protein QME12_06110 [Nanoarchaeota archaeon]|nr:hypothetical protein [Nanoarchaeota archaeon]